jgi:ribosomal protein L37AE/L43A
MVLDLQDWERAGGYYCPKCGQETTRLKEITPGNWGCPDCYVKFAQKFAKVEASLSALSNSKDIGLARRAKRYLMKRMPL